MPSAGDMELARLLLISGTFGIVHGLSCPANGNLKGTVPGWRSEQGFGTMAEAHQILLACPNITSLDIRVSLIGCSQWPDRWNFPFRLAGGDVYPNITSLAIDGFDFLQNDWEDSLPRGYTPRALLTWANFNGPRKWFSLWRDTPRERRNLTNLQLWLEAMDWTKLESLTLNRDTYFDKLAAPQLKALKSLTVGSGYDITSLITSLPEEAALANFSWGHMWNISSLEPLLTRHGKTLKRLDLHANNGGLPMSSSKIEAMCNQTPYLEHLSLSLARNGSWPWEALRSLAGLENLVSADIWLELEADCMRHAPAREHWRKPCGNDSEFREPRLNASSAMEIYSFILDNTKSSNLANVTFYIGDWGPPWDGPIYDPYWLEGRNGKVECTRESLGGPRCSHTVKDEGGFPWNEVLMDDSLWVSIGGDEDEPSESMQLEL